MVVRKQTPDVFSFSARFVADFVKDLKRDFAPKLAPPMPTNVPTPQEPDHRHDFVRAFELLPRAMAQPNGPMEGVHNIPEHNPRPQPAYTASVGAPSPF